MPDDHLDAAVDAVMQAIPDVIISAIRQDHGDPVNTSPEEYIRAALAPHWPTVTEAVANLVLVAKAASISSGGPNTQAALRTALAKLTRDAT